MKFAFSSSWFKCAPPDCSIGLFMTLARTLQA
jgi:hypothetical protein